VVRSEAEQVRDALWLLSEGATDPNVAKGADLLALYAPDETLLKLRRLLR